MAFNKINKGQTDWHIPLNENFSNIENGENLPNNLVKTNNKDVLELPAGDLAVTKYKHGIQWGEDTTTSDDLKPNVPSIMGSGVNGGMSILSANNQGDWFELNIQPKNPEIYLFKHDDMEASGFKQGKIHTSFNFLVEKGSFIARLANTGNTTYDRQFGDYVKQGNQVTVHGEIVISNFDTTEANKDFAVMLPFPISSTVRRAMFQVGYHLSMKNFASYGMHGWSGGSSNQFLIIGIGTNSGMVAPEKQQVLQNGSRFMFGGTYITDV